VFSRTTGSLAAGLIVEQQYVPLKPHGGFDLICNYKPVTEFVGMMLGAMPSQMTNAAPAVAQDCWIEGKIIHVPAAWSTTPMPIFSYPADRMNKLYAIWSYVCGYPNYAIASPNPIAKAATSIALLPPQPGGTTLPGLYSGMSLRIVDGPNSETVTLASTPTGLTITLAAGTAFTHAVPVLPDFVRVTALPEDIEMSTAYLANVLHKTQGFRAMVMPGSPGGVPSQKAMGMAGVLGDYENAMKLLKKFSIVYLHD
jgi:hypothetical protein